MKVGRLVLLAMLLGAVWFVLPGPAQASTKASPDGCAAVGSAVVHCYDCVNRKYLGKVSVLTGYEESKGEGYCVVASEAKYACSSRYGVDKNIIGFYTEFRIGGGTRDETYDTSCVEAVGKP